ncbi:MAG: hypothetical protein ACK559_36995, partial [bacterium]
VVDVRAQFRRDTEVGQHNCVAAGSQDLRLPDTERCPEAATLLDITCHRSAMDVDDRRQARARLVVARQHVVGGDLQSVACLEHERTHLRQLAFQPGPGKSDVLERALFGVEQQEAAGGGVRV